MTLELDDLDAVAVLVGDLVDRVTADLVLAEAHLQRVEREVAPDERITGPEDQLDRLDSLDRPDDARQRAQHTGLCAARRRRRSRRDP